MKLDHSMFSGVSEAELRAWLHDTDGRGYREPWYFTDTVGFAPEIVAKVTRIHRSDRKDPRKMIFGQDGKVLKQVTAVHELDMLFFLADMIGAETREAESKLGQGSRARCLLAEILRALNA